MGDSRYKEYERPPIRLSERPIEPLTLASIESSSSIQHPEIVVNVQRPSVASDSLFKAPIELTKVSTSGNQDFAAVPTSSVSSSKRIPTRLLSTFFKIILKNLPLPEIIDPLPGPSTEPEPGEFSIHTADTPPFSPNIIRQLVHLSEIQPLPQDIEDQPMLSPIPDRPITPDYIPTSSSCN